VTFNFLYLVVLQMKNLKLRESAEGLLADGGHLAVIHVERGHPLAADEALSVDVSQVVAVEPDFGGVHGDEEGNVGVRLCAALDDVGRPAAIVKAVAAFRALHAAVASVELAAHAHREAVSLVLTDELFRPE